ncbi:hypothetical protein Tco_1225250 [Tanacetum coccineum]
MRKPKSDRLNSMGSTLNGENLKQISQWELISLIMCGKETPHEHQLVLEESCASEPFRTIYGVNFVAIEASLGSTTFSPYEAVAWSNLGDDLGFIQKECEPRFKLLASVMMLIERCKLKISCCIFQDSIQSHFRIPADILHVLIKTLIRIMYMPENADIESMGRWRDVKVYSFDNAIDKTYVNLKVSFRSMRRWEADVNDSLPGVVLLARLLERLRVNEQRRLKEMAKATEAT